MKKILTLLLTGLLFMSCEKEEDVLTPRPQIMPIEDTSVIQEDTLIVENEPLTVDYDTLLCFKIYGTATNVNVALSDDRDNHNDTTRYYNVELPAVYVFDTFPGSCIGISVTNAGDDWNEDLNDWSRITVELWYKEKKVKSAGTAFMYERSMSGLSATIDDCEWYYNLDND
jgi:hypothetical protein